MTAQRRQMAGQLGGVEIVQAILGLGLLHESALVVGARSASTCWPVAAALVGLAGRDLLVALDCLKLELGRCLRQRHGSRSGFPLAIHEGADFDRSIAEVLHPLADLRTEVRRCRTPGSRAGATCSMLSAPGIRRRP
jgi:hypothetical protein